MNILSNTNKLSNEDKYKLSQLLRINLDDFIYQVLDQQITQDNELDSYQKTTKIKALPNSIEAMTYDDKKDLALKHEFHGGFNKTLEFKESIKNQLTDFEENDRLDSYDTYSYGMNFDKLDKILPSSTHLRCAMNIYLDERPKWFQSYIDERATEGRTFRKNNPKAREWAFGIHIPTVFKVITEEFGVSKMEAYQFIANELQVEGYKDTLEIEARPDGDKYKTTFTTKGADRIRSIIKKP